MFAGVLLFLFFGASTADLGKFFKSPPAWIFFAVIFIIVFMFSIQQAFPQIYPTPEMLANMTTEEGEINPAIIVGPMSFLFTFGNPRVLGVIAFLLLVGIIGIIVVIQTKGD
jgi:hypothetical protein